jgi:hypothetical protein
MRGQAGALVVAEPTTNRPLCGHKGALWLKATTRGVTAHGSMPDKGVNAIYAAARAVGRLEAFDFNVARHPVMGAPTLNVGTLHGGLNLNSVPDRAEIGIDIRNRRFGIGGRVDLSQLLTEIVNRSLRFPINCYHAAEPRGKLKSGRGICGHCSALLVNPCSTA